MTILHITQRILKASDHLKGEKNNHTRRSFFSVDTLLVQKQVRHKSIASQTYLKKADEKY